jgi:hypothetical protein|tara:strand:+ start:441 stop:596 length:156 start_codon:yes stop_codon:yes gene_type:complete
MLQGFLIVLGLIILTVSILMETGGVALILANKPEGFSTYSPAVVFRNGRSL